MGTTQTTQTQVKAPGKVYFYYPAWNKRFARRTLAGVAEGNTLYVSQAVAFPGIKPKSIPVKMANGSIVYIVDPGIKRDTFNKKEGRALATQRATGVKKVGDKTFNVGRTTIFEVYLPNGEDLNTGKAFVEACEKYLEEKGFPKKAKTPKAQPEPNQP